MSSNKGESFESRIALILNSGGFIVKERPHRVKFEGQTIGDLDVLAEDPNTHSMIGVSCKEWFGQTPGSEQFSHFIEMLEVENIKYGIFASATDISNAIIPRIEYTRKQKGINVIILSYDEIKKLEDWAYSKQDFQVEDYFRNFFGLGISKRTTVGDVLKTQKVSQFGKTYEIDKMIPVNYYDEPPEYIKNIDFSSHEAVLRIEPYLLIEYDIHVEARQPRTGQVLEERSDHGIFVIDAAKGKVLGKEDPEFDHLQKYYTNAEFQYKIQEKGFTIKKSTPAINDREFTNMLREQVALQNQIETSYTNANDEEVPVIKRPRPEDVKILSKNMIFVPIWDVVFSFGTKSYRRVYFGYDGFPIRDEMERCLYCKKKTISICTDCKSVTCENHEHLCLSCNKILCVNCSKFCTDCNSRFCSQHIPKNSCAVCKKILCTQCDTNTCKSCKSPICREHRINCTVCHQLVCNRHLLSKKFAKITTKNFCSNECMNRYEEDYNSSGMFGKFKKIIKK